MGSGKTTVGAKVAVELGCEFVDLDDVVVESVGKSIAEIFHEDGEKAFRDAESEALVAMSDFDGVLATGGGCVIRPANRRLIAGFDKVVWLRAKPETLVQRIPQDGSRPLLNDYPLEDLLRMADERMELYREAASDIVDVDNLSIDDVVAAVTHIASRPSS
jgi:shikimate kinase